jgi:hypothetical protein
MIRDIISNEFMGEIRQILKIFFFLFFFKGYTCRFKSEAFASFASIVLRPWLESHHVIGTD